jgi:hypothetical protein
MKRFIQRSSQVVFLLFLSAFSYAQSQEYKFAEAYIKGLGYRYELEVKAESDLSEAGNDISQKNMASMRNTHRGILKLREAINILLPYKNSSREYIREATENVITWYTNMIDNYNNGLDALEKLTNATSENNSNIDMGKLSRTVTEITAKQEYISESLFQLTTLIAMILIDEVPDKNNHVSFLLITSKERKNLLNELYSFFDKSLLINSKKNPKYTIASAIILNTILTGDHKSSDERNK